MKKENSKYKIFDSDIYTIDKRNNKNRIKLIICEDMLIVEKEISDNFEKDTKDDTLSRTGTPLITPHDDKSKSLINIDINKKHSGEGRCAEPRIKSLKQKKVSRKCAYYRNLRVFYSSSVRQLKEAGRG